LPPEKKPTGADEKRRRTEDQKKYEILSNKREQPFS
jgi:hypothetical protein